MSDLYVDTAGLRVVASALGRVEDDLLACAATLRAATADGLGDAGFDSACADFVGTWSYGTGELGEAATVVRQVLAEALRVYDQIDAELASAAAG